MNRMFRPCLKGGTLMTRKRVGEVEGRTQMVNKEGFERDGQVSKAGQRTQELQERKETKIPLWNRAQTHRR